MLQHNKKAFEGLNITHVKTTAYRHWRNEKCERSHRALMDVLSKKILNNPHTWDLYLNQALAALRFSVTESTKLVPHFFCTDVTQSYAFRISSYQEDDIMVMTKCIRHLCWYT